MSGTLILLLSLATFAAGVGGGELARIVKRAVVRRQSGRVAHLYPSEIVDIDFLIPDPKGAGETIGRIMVEYERLTGKRSAIRDALERCQPLAGQVHSIADRKAVEDAALCEGIFLKVREMAARGWRKDRET